MAILYGCNNRRRFSIKLPDGTVQRFGTCDPKDQNDDRYLWLCGGVYYLVNKDTKEHVVLSTDTLVANGYYDQEHDGWKTIDEFLKEQ